MVNANRIWHIARNDFQLVQMKLMGSVDFTYILFSSLILQFANKNFRRTVMEKF